MGVEEEVPDRRTRERERQRKLSLLLLDCYWRLPSSMVDVVEYGMYMPFVSICGCDGDCDQRDVDMRLFPEVNVEEPWDIAVFDHWPGIGSSLFPREIKAASARDMFIHRSCNTNVDTERERWATKKEFRSYSCCCSWWALRHWKSKAEWLRLDIVAMRIEVLVVAVVAFDWWTLIVWAYVTDIAVAGCHSTFVLAMTHLNMMMIRLEAVSRSVS